MTYHWLRVRADERNWSNAYARFKAAQMPTGVDLWGAFFGLFGIGSNELVLVLHSDAPAPTDLIAEAGFEVVDYLVAFSEDTPLSLVEQVSPAVLVKGEDWRDKGVVGSEWVEAHGGQVVLVPLQAGFSTTRLLERIRGLP